MSLMSAIKQRLTCAPYFNFFLSLLDSFDLYHCAYKHTGIGSNFPERVDILFCIINHFRIICSNQMKKKWFFQQLNF